MTVIPRFFSKLVGEFVIDLVNGCPFSMCDFDFFLFVCLIVAGEAISSLLCFFAFSVVMSF